MENGLHNKILSGFMDFSDIFDLPRLRESLHMPLIEWKDVKDIKAGMERPLEPLGCWTLWAPYDDQKSPRPNYITGELQLGLGKQVYSSYSMVL